MPNSIQSLIQTARRRLVAGDAVRGAAAVLALLLGAGLALMLADVAVRLPSGLRLAALAALIGAAAALIRSGLVLPFLRRRRPEAVAVELERRFGVDQNRLINAWQFERGELAEKEKPFAGEVVREGGDALDRIPPADLLDLRTLRRGLIRLALLLAACAAFGLAAPRHASAAFLRLLLPLADIPPAGRVVLELPPGPPPALDEGDAFTIRLRAFTPEDRPLSRPPRLRLAERTGFAPVHDPGPDAPALLPVEGDPLAWSFTVPKTERTFAFRIFAEDAFTRSVAVTVRPAPRLASSSFHLTPPAYAGLPAVIRPGPPAPVSALPGSRLGISLRVEPDAARVLWTGDGEPPLALERKDGLHEAAWIVTNAGAYRLLAERADGKTRLLAEGRLALEEDQPPTVEFETAERNRFVNPGVTIELPVRAEDDYGVRSIAVRARPLEGKNGLTNRLLRTWSFMGPPGQTRPAPARLILALDPALFPPGSTWALEAEAADFAPAERTGLSSPVMLRIREAKDVGAEEGHPLANALALLRETVAAQEKANMAAENLRLNLAEALLKKHLAAQGTALRDLQAAAQAAGRKALEAFRAAKEDGAGAASKLEPLVNGEMEIVRAGLGGLETPPESLETRLAGLRERQDHILAELLALLGRSADPGEREKAKETKAKADEPPPQEARQRAEELREDLLDFVEAQKKIIEKSRTLLDKAPADLTEEEEKILGELAREEAKWATFFEEKLTDFSKLPLQDFADGALAEEFNETFMEMKKAAKALYEKNVELAVPHEQSGLENAEELVQNLEKWLSDKPDNLKWLMEEPMAPADIAMADLPAELEDIVGELLDKEEEMTEEVEDVSSSWLDSVDKGAGWDALDGPISSMSAKGVTGNMLPNQMEIGGRAGEGRSGRSSGQMVEETAQGKGGRETPTRLSPSPFESGSVEDSSKESPGGATGGGKLSGFAGEGLRGPTPPPLQQQMARLAGQQAQIRQAAEALALRLRAWNAPGADLETAVQHMRELEAAAARGYGPGVKQAFTQALDTLEAARESAGGAGALRRDSSALSEKRRQELGTALQDGIPAGYEEMAGAYFRQLAEEAP